MNTVFLQAIFLTENLTMQKVKLVEQMTMAKAAEIRATKNDGKAVELPSFRPGDTVNIAVRVIEGEKDFQGIVIARRGSGVNETFRVRKVSNGVGVERIFPLHSPTIQNLTVVRNGSVRRAKLYYLRGMSEKKIRAKLS